MHMCVHQHFIQPQVLLDNIQLSNQHSTLIILSTHTFTTQPVTHQYIYSPLYLSAHPPTHTTNHSMIHLPIHSLIHSFIHPKSLNEPMFPETLLRIRQATENKRSQSQVCPPKKMPKPQTARVCPVSWTWRGNASKTSSILHVSSCNF